MSPLQISNNIGTTLEVSKIIKASCYDCHSGHSTYNWYSEVMPIGWIIDHDIKDGLEHFNFDSLFAYSPKKRDHKLEELIEEVEHKEMPLSIYTIIHKEAKLNDQQIIQIVAWARGLRNKENTKF